MQKCKKRLNFKKKSFIVVAERIYLAKEDLLGGEDGYNDKS